MGIRMTGLISGMDTETIIKQMMDAQKMKNKRTTDKRDLLSFKQEKWKDLNTKLLKLYTDDLGKMRFQSNYMSKQVTSSNEDIISVVANGSSAPEGTHTIEVTNSASSQYVTGTSLKDANGKILSGSTKLSTLGVSATSIFTVKTKDGEKSFEVDENTTLSAFAAQLRDSGISANYDESQGRFFLGSKAGGADSYFSLTTTDDPSIADRRKIHETVGYDQLTAENQQKVDAAYVALRGTDPTAKGEAEELLRGFAKDKVAATAGNIATDRTIEELKEAIKNGQTYAGTDYTGIYGAMVTSAESDMQRIHPDWDVSSPEYQEELGKMVDSELTKRATGEVKGSADMPISADMQAIIDGKKNDIITNGTTLTSTAADGTVTNTVIKSESDVVAELNANMANYAGGSAADTTGELAKMGLTEVKTTTDGNGNVTTSVTDSNVTLIQAESTEIKYNGTTLTSDSNIINVNGLTITIKGETAAGEKINLNVSNNSQNTYDMIKGFVKSYNSILTEMNTLYYAPSAKAYAPLSDDERAAMSDDQVKKWEGKIKDSILRRDDSVNSIMSTMKMAVNESVEVNGKRYSLASFGIQTSTDYTEKGLLHIYGDKEDSTYAAENDKLMKAIKEDPDTVMKVFSEIATNLYADLGEKCSGISNVRSSQNFYNDKEMDKLQDSYKKQIKVLEKKLTKMEDKYYKQFAAMESALAKMQSQTNALTGMLGN